MTNSSTIRLFLLGAIWGCSFLFLRLSIDALGPALLTLLRIGIAALFLTLALIVLKHKITFKGQLHYFIILGILNTALPFFLFSYAAQNLPASLMSILNSTVPSWGVIIYAIAHKTRPSVKSIIGLLCGISGVAILAGFDSNDSDNVDLVAVFACLSATFCYALASLYAKSNAKVHPYDNAHISLYCACAMLVPMLWVYPPPTTQNFPFLALLAVAALGILCTGVAYLLYFKLLEEIGQRVLTVTFLVPLFGVIWGWIFLNEYIGLHTLLGGFLILCGTMLVIGFSIKNFRRPRQYIS